MTAYAVYHTQKGSGSGGGLGNHIDRVPGKEHTYKNADPERRHLNADLIKKAGKSLSECVSERIAKGYTGKKAIRKDAVKFLAHVFTGSHERMNELFKKKENRELAQAWVNENYAFACREFGKENIVRFTLHLDEKTPHIHCVTVPLTTDGRLSAKEVVGDRKTLKGRQDRYAEAMAKFGLQRGLSAGLTGNRHETVQEYEKRLARQNAVTVDLEPVRAFGIVRKGKTIEKQRNELKKAKNAVLSLSAEVERKTELLAQADKNYKQVVQENKELYAGLKYTDYTNEVRQKHHIQAYENPEQERAEQVRRERERQKQRAAERERRILERKNSKGRGMKM